MKTSQLVVAWGDKATPLQLEHGPAIQHTAGRHEANDRLWAHAGGGLGFHGWLSMANARCEDVEGLCLLDLPARDWREEYQGRVPPEEAADVAVDEYAALHGTQHKLPQEKQMTKHRLIVVQIFKAIREVTIEVEAATREDARKQQYEADAPGFDDPGWRTTWDLQHEGVDHA